LVDAESFKELHLLYGKKYSLQIILLLISFSVTANAMARKTFNFFGRKREVDICSNP
jgi:hypothetical protein